MWDPLGGSLPDLREPGSSTWDSSFHAPEKARPPGRHWKLSLHSPSHPSHSSPKIQRPGRQSGCLPAEPYTMGWGRRGGGALGDQRRLCHNLQAGCLALATDRQLSASWVCSHLPVKHTHPTVFCAQTPSPKSWGAQVTGPPCEEAGPTETTRGAPLCDI